MPYIKQEQRDAVDRQIEALVEAMKNAPDYENSKKGILNYIYTKINIGFMDGKVRYGKVNDICGAMLCSILELYRRLGVPYEMIKTEENGDLEWPM